MSTPQICNIQLSAALLIDGHPSLHDLISASAGAIFEMTLLFTWFYKGPLSL